MQRSSDIFHIRDVTSQTEDVHAVLVGLPSGEKVASKRAKLSLLPSKVLGFDSRHCRKRRTSFASRPAALSPIKPWSIVLQPGYECSKAQE
jgi:hypothetical protein